MIRCLRYIVVGVLVAVAATAPAQHALRLQQHNIEHLLPVNTTNIDSLQKRNASFDGKRCWLLQFQDIPSVAAFDILHKAGILLQQYVPDHSYVAVVTGDINVEVLKATGVTGIYRLQPEDKLSVRLARGNIPPWAMNTDGGINVLLHFDGAFSWPSMVAALQQSGVHVTDTSWRDYHFITVKLKKEQAFPLAAQPFVMYVEPVAPPPKNFNYAMRANTRANVLNADVSQGGEGLRGAGVTIGVGDDADPSQHVDLRDRLINRAAGIPSSHGTHVAGIAAGAGIKDPLYQGVAPLATIVAQLFNGIFLNAGVYINDYHMMVTNNSWGNITGECDLAGVYDTYSRLMDEIAIRYPYLLNVFAAGNDGPYTCQGFPTQYHTVVSGHQSAKNVLSVAWGEKNRTVSVNSSVGPTADGRLKPEITSQGSGVRSTVPVDDYLTDWGTSMAAPSVSGGAALLIEKFRQLNSGTDPKSGLIKALLMNGAVDIEQPAPDFKSGYGFLNLIRSLDMVKQHHYFQSTITNGATNNHVIAVPSNTAQLKVMVYWHDPAAAIFAQQVLVNDIDLSVSNGTTTTLPWVLNGTASSVASNAVRGNDHLNNSEQVTIDNPAAGNYNIIINGTAINSGSPQEYFVVYDMVPVSIDLTYPSAAESFIPGEAMVINWDAFGGPQNNFTLEFSVDGGNTWTVIDNSIPATARQYNWNAPATTDKAMLRLSRNGTGLSDLTLPFVVLGVPAVNLSPVQCEDYININWNAIAGATDYEVMMKQGVQMVPVAVTNNTSYVFSGLNRDTTYYVTVRARIAGKPARRAVAISRKPDNGSCTGNISDHDLKIDSVLTQHTGRKFTGSEITATTLQVRVKNLDDAAATGFLLQYSLNGGAFVTDNVNATIPANGVYVHSFTGMNFSAPGDYRFVIVVKNNVTDANTSNDTTTVVIRQLPNTAVTLPVTENFDATPAFEIIKDTMGLPGLDRWDFFSNGKGRIRSFVNTGIAHSGNRAITLDVQQYTVPTTDFLVATYNLSGYNNIPAADAGLLLSFHYKHHGLTPHPNNRVWARRSDADNWIEVFSFDSIPLPAGVWKQVTINLSATVAAIQPTSSFQLRFGATCQLPMGDNISNDGITIDDVMLVAAPGDAGIVSVDSTLINRCGNGTNVPLTVNFIAGKLTTSCVNLKYQLDGGPVVSECAPLNTSRYRFVNGMNVSTPGLHQLVVWTDVPGDTYHLNDTFRTSFYAQPVVKVFPYLQDFEQGSDGWYANGYRSSWQLGTPASFRINTAASGTHAWKTALRGQYNENEESYLYSPCFDLSALRSPFLAFDLAMDIEQCQQFLCDAFWVEYSTDGKTWKKLGVYGQGINWYNRPVENVWDSANYTSWHIAGFALPAGVSQLQLRFVLKSDAGVSREGVAIDNVQVYDQQYANISQQWRVAPNPVAQTGYLISNHPAGTIVTWQISNTAGQVIKQQTFIASGLVQKTPFGMEGLPKGVYLFVINDGTTRRTFKLLHVR